MTLKTATHHDCKDCVTRHQGVFCNLKKQVLSELQKHKAVNTYKKNQIIFYEGSHPLGFYCIISGRVKLYKCGLEGHHQIIRIAGPGDLLGYRSLFADEPYHATAETLEDCQLCCIDKHIFFSIMSQNQELLLNIVKKLARELRVAENLLTTIAQKSVRERMAELLLNLKKNYGKLGKNGIRINLELSRREMAELIGVTQETSIRLLSEFKREKVIDVNERQITILNPDALVEMAHWEE